MNCRAGEEDEGDDELVAGDNNQATDAADGDCGRMPYEERDGRTDGRTEGSILVAMDAQPRVDERKAGMRGSGATTRRRRRRRRRRQQQQRKDCLRITNTTDGRTAYPLVFRSIHSAAAAAAAALMMLMLLCSVQSGAVFNNGKERN